MKKIFGVALLGFSVLVLTGAVMAQVKPLDTAPATGGGGKVEVKSTTPTLTSAVTIIDKFALHLGDVNGDGSVTVKDVTLVLSLAVGYSGFNDIQTASADLNGDGRLNMMDVTLALRIAVGLMPQPRWGWGDLGFAGDFEDTAVYFRQDPQNPDGPYIGRVYKFAQLNDGRWLVSNAISGVDGIVSSYVKYGQDPVTLTFAGDGEAFYNGTRGKFRYDYATEELQKLNYSGNGIITGYLQPSKDWPTLEDGQQYVINGFETGVKVAKLDRVAGTLTDVSPLIHWPFYGDGKGTGLKGITSIGGSELAMLAFQENTPGKNYSGGTFFVYRMKVGKDQFKDTQTWSVPVDKNVFQSDNSGLAYYKGRFVFPVTEERGIENGIKNAGLYGATMWLDPADGTSGLFKWNQRAWMTGRLWVDQSTDTLWQGFSGWDPRPGLGIVALEFNPVLKY